MGRRTVWNWLLIVLLLFILLVSFIIALQLGRYTVPQVDDFHYGALTKHAWDDTHNLVEVLRSARTVTETTYNDWQGTYSAIFLMAMQPGIFGIQYYRFATPFLIGSLIISIFFFVSVFVKFILHGSRSESVIISAIACIACINYVPFPVEAFYWYNGAVYYTFFFALELVVFGLVILYWKGQRGRRILSAILICILCPIIAGGSYAVALLSAVVLLVLSGYSFYAKQIRPAVLISIRSDSRIFMCQRFCSRKRQPHQYEQNRY